MDAKLNDAMKSIYDFTTCKLRNNCKSKEQRDALYAILRGDRDVLISFPPAAGKSLCYILPAVLDHDRTTLVFVQNSHASRELEEQLKDYDFVNGTYHFGVPQPYHVKKEIARETIPMAVPCLVYVPVPMCTISWVKEMIMTLYRDDAINMIVVDDAHLISHNTVEYKKSYNNLAVIRKMMPNVPLVALTSIPTQQIKSDIIDGLGMKNVHDITHTDWPRKNISLQVKLKDTIAKPFEDMRDMLRKFMWEKKATIVRGLILCRSAEETEIVAEQFSKMHFETLAYNHKMSEERREEIRKRWSPQDVRILAATHRFAAGLDCNDVTFVIHWSMPSSISQYYGDIGRVGRNGEIAFCCLYFSVDDWMYGTSITMGRNPQAYNDFLKMLEFCHSTECRHVLLSQFLGINIPSCRDSCDSCLQSIDVFESLQDFVDFKNQHQLLPDSSVIKTVTVPECLEVYCAKDTEVIAKNLSLKTREKCYDKLVNALVENYEAANCPNKRHFKVQHLSRLARILEYFQFNENSRKQNPNYAPKMHHLVKTIIADTNIRKMSNYILNYDYLTERTKKSNRSGNSDDLNFLPMKKPKI